MTSLMRMPLFDFAASFASWRGAGAVVNSGALVCANASTVSNTKIVKTGANERFLISLSFREQDVMADRR
jgi:hypothetical protein